MKKLIILLSLVIICPAVFSQESGKITPYVTLQYFKNNGDSSYLRITLTYSKNRVEIPLEGLKIIFRSGDSAGRILSEGTTGEKGVAICNLNLSGLSKDDNGFRPFTASFDGNDSVEAASAELNIRDASLIMECSEADSVKTISLKAEKFENGKMVPAGGEVVNVYVPRMFSMLPVGEVTLDDNGTGSVEFPSDLPGDLNGNVYVIARFEEHPEFGNIERKEVRKWGVPFVATNHTSKRALWTKTAPKWMIYTLTILLAGVWSHYLFSIISLIRIKLDSRKKKVAVNKSEEYFNKP
ncbi:MAG TPA: hypothetical protein VK155_19540 [Bacteroidales bacterium]|jgi:hypothetical protein|nr:hypothetical protein [Bacteroidales bacterium]